MKYSDYLKNLSKCPFCNTAEGEKLAQNEHAFMTYSVAPYHPDHLLVIPRRHIEHILDLSDDEIRSIDSLQKLGLKLLSKLGHTNMSVLVKEGDQSEKTVPHTHYHIIPDVILETSDHTGAERMILTDDEAADAISRLGSALKTI